MVWELHIYKPSTNIFKKCFPMLKKQNKKKQQLISNITHIEPIKIYIQNVVTGPK